MVANQGPTKTTMGAIGSLNCFHISLRGLALCIMPRCKLHFNQTLVGIDCRKMFLRKIKGPLEVNCILTWGHVDRVRQECASEERAWGKGVVMG
jgi:hypothetical protein